MSTHRIAHNLNNNVNDSDLIMAVRQRMARNPGAPVGLERLADRLGVSTRQLNAAFQRSLGVSAAVYVRGERMRIAQRLLLQTSRSVQNIADELGFSGPANFSSAFRDFTGMTPSEFRKNSSAEVTLSTSSDLKWG